ncbi:MAG: hypothetical protein J5928_00125 [Firmicutes bacterium]|nr:hypothetical protein [Bacillota bacterium]
MIKSSIKKRTYQAIYRLLNRVSPLDSDCGTLCGAACCTSERNPAANGIDCEGINNGDAMEVAMSEEMGIYLLPGEDKIHDKKDSWLTWSSEDTEDYDFPKSWKGKVYFVQCKGPSNCKRELRPMQCRTFPLAPHIDEAGKLSLVYNDIDLPYRCPLIDEEMPLNDSFVQATFTVWKHLIDDPLIYDLVKMDSELREDALAELLDKLGG